MAEEGILLKKAQKLYVRIVEAKRASSGKKHGKNNKEEGFDEAFKKFMDDTSNKIFGLMENFEVKLTKKMLITVI
jgi:hypothetical protein